MSSMTAAGGGRHPVPLKVPHGFSFSRSLAYGRSPPANAGLITDRATTALLDAAPAIARTATFARWPTVTKALERLAVPENNRPRLASEVTPATEMGQLRQNFVLQSEAENEIYAGFLVSFSNQKPGMKFTPALFGVPFS